MKKKRWEKPKLVVLVRWNTAENVLTGCKGLTRNGPAGGQEACTPKNVGCYSCLSGPVS